MATVKGEEEDFSWLDNSFVSVTVNSVHDSHSAKRNRRSAVANKRRKSAKLHCVTQKDNADNISIGAHQQRTSVACRNEVCVNTKETAIAQTHSGTEEDQNANCVNSAVDINKQDLPPIPLVFFDCF